VVDVANRVSRAMKAVGLVQAEPVGVGARAVRAIRGVRAGPGGTGGPGGAGSEFRHRLSRTELSWPERLVVVLGSFSALVLFVAYFVQGEL
jgi:hypothetical protein